MEKIRTEREKDRQTFDASLAVDSREAARQAARVQSDAAKEAAKLQVAATREVAQRQIRIGWLAAAAAVAAAIAAAASAVATIIQITMK